MRDLRKVPASPVYALMVRPAEEFGLVLTLDGEEIAAAPDIKKLREIGLTELRVRAALAGRPVRARAVEPASPTPWNMIVCPDGHVHDVATHPDPPLQQPLPPPPVAERAPAVPVPPASLVPENHRTAWAALWAAYATGDLPAAVALAQQLEAQLAAEYGPGHPDTITVLSARVWLTLIQRTDPRGTAELLITTALRRQATRARPELETARTARNAHAVWRILRDQDPEGAREMAEPLADMLAILGEDACRRDVLDWIAVGLHPQPVLTPPAPSTRGADPGVERGRRASRAQPRG